MTSLQSRDNQIKPALLETGCKQRMSLEKKCEDFIDTPIDGVEPGL